jgi:hypothetical protein
LDYAPGSIAAVLTGAIVALCTGPSVDLVNTDLVAQKSGLRLVRSSASAAMVPPMDFSKKQNNGHGASSSTTLLPRCLGLGLVRGLDVARRVVYVSSPLGPAQMAQVNLVQKGRLDTPPLAFGRDDFFEAVAASFAAALAASAAIESGAASSSSQVLPYLSTSTLSASSGFGAKQMQSRHNLGRRRLA